MSKRMLLALACLIFSSSLVNLAFAQEFLTSLYYPGVDKVYWMATGDVNNDGHMDIVVVSGYYGGGGVYVALGKADGSFQAPVQIYNGLNEGYMTLGDVNGDGNLDIVADYYLGNPPQVVVFLGRGDGTFAAPILTSAISRPTYLAVGDLNRDGRLDVVTASPQGKLAVFLGNGDGTFQALPEISVALKLTTVAIGDFDKDGNPDVLVSGEQTTVYFLKGKGNGTFQTANAVQHSDGSAGLLIADFNRDGNLDFASSTIYQVGNYSAVSVLLGNGDGTFQPQIPTAFYSYPQMSAADVNGDGKLDLVNSAGGVALGNGDGTFAPTQVFNLEGSGTFMAVADVNGDGKLDMYGAGYSGTLVVARGRGDGTFVAARTYSGTLGGGGVIGDFNGDGKLDSVGAIGGTNMTGQILLGNGDGSFTPGPSFSTAYGTQQGAAGDMNNDGKLDLVFAEFYDVSVLLGQGDGTFPQHHEFGKMNFGVAVTLGDFNKDGKLDVAASDAEGSGVNVFLGNGDGTLQKQVHYSASSAPGQLIAADIDGDGNLDLVVTNSAYTSDNNATLLYGNGDGSFQPGVQLNTISRPNGVGAGDLNGDGKMDLVFTTVCPDLNVCDEQASVYLGAGNRTFTHLADYPVGFSDFFTGIVRIRDLQSDGKLDVVTFVSGFDMSQNINVLLGNGDGTLTPAGAYTGGTDVIELADFNQDGAVDLEASSRGGITVFLNTAGTSIRTNGNPNPSKVGDRVTLSARVAASVIAQPVPTGKVTFKDGSTIMKAVTLDKNGRALFTTLGLSVGTHVITTRYSGDGHFFPKNGPDIVQVVNP